MHQILSAFAFLVALCTLTTLNQLLHAEEAKANHPNILFIMADDK